MPEYLAPGVYVEETSFRAKSIEGVSTTTTGFVGPTRYGPVDLEPDIITGLGEFERIYGDRQKLSFADPLEMHNYMWHAVRAFFEEGGKRLYIARVFNPLKGEYPPASFDTEIAQEKIYDDGHARGMVPTSVPSPPDEAIELRARFPGAAGNRPVLFTVRLGQNLLGGKPSEATISALTDNDIVWIGDITSPISSPPGPGSLYIATYDKDEKTWRFGETKTKSNQDWRLNTTSSTFKQLDPERGDSVKVVTLTVTVLPTDSTGSTAVWEGLAPDPEHSRDGLPDSLSAKFSENPSSLAMKRSLPVVISVPTGWTGLDILKALFYEKPTIETVLNDPKSRDSVRTVEVRLEGGNDGNRPMAKEYEGKGDEDKRYRTGLKAFEDIEDISIVAAPGSTFFFENPAYKGKAQTITNFLISHATNMRYRIAVLDSGNGQSIAEVRAMRAKIDSKYAALYYPWVTILDPVTGNEIAVPPSGHVAGIYARNDINRAVYKAPANEVVNLAIGFETLLNKSQQEVLNPEGINCFRFFEGRGFRLWGARTISSDPEWKYVNLRRYFAYLERSIDRGTQWAVFEPNGEALWSNVRLTIQDFLFNEWVSGALLGEKPERAYFVRCDRSTMTQNDLDNGRLVCLIGLAVVKPAEFVIFRIGQWTADAKR